MNHNLRSLIFYKGIVYYVIFLIIIVAVEFYIEYSIVDVNINNQLKLYQSVFEKDLATAVWLYDNQRTKFILDGMTTLPPVTSVSLFNQYNELVEQSKSKSYSKNIIENIAIEFKLNSVTHNENNKVRYVGKVVLKSSTFAALIEMKFAFFIFLLNLFLVSFLLFALFYFLIHKYLLNLVIPLSNSLYNLNLNNLENQNILALKSDYPQELKILIFAFNNMFNKLKETKRTIDEINQNLEKKVNEKTVELFETLNELKKNQATVTHLAKLTSLGEMAGGIAHEINNPLTIITGNIHLINSMINREELDIKLLKENMETIKQTTKRISDITQGLLTFSRKETNEEYALEKLNQIIVQTCILCGEKFRNEGIQLTIPEIADNILIKCNAVQISQVLLNLLNNANYVVKSLKERWIRIEVYIKENNIHIAVTDSGLGIPKEIQSKIMEPFFTSKKVGEGTGLGLSVSLGIMRAHGGNLILNTESKHTQFVMILPIAAIS